MLILIADAFDASLPKRLARFGEVTTDSSRLGEADVVLVRSKTKVTAEYVAGAPRLRLVIRGGVGLDNIDVEHAESRGIVVHNTADASTIAVAELAFALMIALPNHLVRADESMRAGRWIKSELTRTELYGKTLGVAGMGRIGTAVAERARAFGMSVLGLDLRHARASDAALRDRLWEHLGRCDYVTLSFPHREENAGLVDASLLARMRPGAYLINTGRAECVNEADVADALASERLAGFATDVWLTDPPDGSPLIGAPNCLLTPHIGASTHENMTRIGDVVERILEDFDGGNAESSFPQQTQ